MFLATSLFEFLDHALSESGLMGVVVILALLLAGIAIWQSQKTSSANADNQRENVKFQNRLVDQGEKVTDAIKISSEVLGVLKDVVPKLLVADEAQIRKLDAIEHHVVEHRGSTEQYVNRIIEEVQTTRTDISAGIGTMQDRLVLLESVPEQLKALAEIIENLFRHKEETKSETTSDVVQ